MSILFHCLLGLTISIASTSEPSIEPSMEQWNEVLSKHVDEFGKVAYEAIKKDPASLNGYIHWLENIDLEEMKKDEQLATLINAYNAFTIQLIVEHWPIDSIKDIPRNKRWTHRRWNLGGTVVSLDDIEHTMIRPVFKKPEIHFALVCASNGCPPLRNIPFTGKDLDLQLEMQAHKTHSDTHWYNYDRSTNTLYVSRIYKWYARDFTGQYKSVLQFISTIDPLVERAIRTGRNPKIRYLEYDWSLNNQKTDATILPE